MRKTLLSTSTLLAAVLAAACSHPVAQASPAPPAPTAQPAAPVSQPPVVKPAPLPPGTVLTSSDGTVQSTASRVDTLAQGDSVVISNSKFHYTIVAGPPAAVVTPPPVTPPPVTPPPVTASGFNEPTGYVTQVNTGAITTPPSCGAAQTSWTVNGGNWSMFSTTTTDATGHNCANLQLVTGGHSGYRVYYPPGVHGGSSPVMFGTPFPNGPGTGNLYVRYVERVESGWTTNGNVGVKNFEPRTPSANGGGNAGGTGQNDVLGTSSGGVNGGAWLQMLQQGSSTTDLPCWEYCKPYSPTIGWPAASTWYADSNANLGHNPGVWRTVEWLVTVNSPLGSNTGCLTIWVNKVKEWNECDVKWFIAGNTAAWNYLMSDATYGGGTNAVPAGSNVAWDFDSLYVSTK